MSNKLIVCRFCGKEMKGKKCKCGASYKIVNDFGEYKVWRKEIK